MILPTLEFERNLWANGYRHVAGVDEVGRGAWAGPVVAAAVILPIGCCLYSESGEIRLPRLLRDSKQLSPLQRQQVAIELRQLPISWAVGIVDIPQINQSGVGRATFAAMSSCLTQLNPVHEFVLIDGFRHPEIDPVRQQHIIKGDALVASIAAASVLAKVYRDELMAKLDAEYPGYGLAEHKGYGTKQHQQAIKAAGLSPIHRKSFHLKFLDFEI